MNTQLYPPKTNTLPIPTWPFSPESVKAFILSMAQDGAINANANLATKYRVETFGDFLASYDLGRLAYDAIAPAPPNSFLVRETVDGGFELAGLGPAVCDVPTFARKQAPQTTVVIPDPVYAVGDVMNNPVGDVWPVGHIETDPTNGNEYQKMSHGSPFSATRIVYFYQRIK